MIDAYFRNSKEIDVMRYISRIRHIAIIMLLSIVWLAGCSSNSITINSTSNAAPCGPLQIDQTTPPTSSTIPQVDPPNSPSTNELPGGRSFLRDIILLVVCVPQPKVSTINKDLVENQLPQEIHDALNSFPKPTPIPGVYLQPVFAMRSYAEPWLDNRSIPSTEMTLDPVIRFGNQVIIVYHLLHTDPKDARDDTAVDYIRGHVGEINSSAPIKILTAAPDWYSTGTCGGCDSPRGQPGGSPTEPTPSLTPSQVAMTPTLPSGDSWTVYVLDTGYGVPFTTPHFNLGECKYTVLYTGAMCLTASTPLLQTKNPLVHKIVADATSAGNTFITGLASKVDQWDQMLPTDSAYIPPPKDAYPDATPDHLPSSFDGAVDHGLFISSLIHEIAPAASIQLIRVLNDDDVGEMSFLLRSLQTIYEQISPHCQCIINLSLAMGPLNAAGIGAQFYPVELALDALRTDKGAMIIAASGNYTSGKEPAPSMPTFPALFCGVVSVASVNATGTLDTFSAPARDQSSGSAICIQDSITPTVAGIPIMTARPMTSQALAAMAIGDVCGVYLQPLADPNHVAFWSGTSFAAAIASGYVAATGTGNLPGGTLPLSQPMCHL
jgi:hypothetical protein